VKLSKLTELIKKGIYYAALFLGAGVKAGSLKAWLQKSSGKFLVKQNSYSGSINNDRSCYFKRSIKNEPNHADALKVLES
jgi:hypothetical protein